jgi:hypothetical protein
VTPADTLDMFAELPRAVQVAILSAMHGMRSRGTVAFTDYAEAHVIEYIEATGLLTVRRMGSSIRLSANDNTAVLRANLRTCLEMTGFEFIAS